MEQLKWGIVTHTHFCIAFLTSDLGTCHAPYCLHIRLLTQLDLSSQPYIMYYVSQFLMIVGKL